MLFYRLAVRASDDNLVFSQFALQIKLPFIPPKGTRLIIDDERCNWDSLMVEVISYQHYTDTDDFYCDLVYHPDGLDDPYCKEVGEKLRNDILESYGLEMSKEDYISFCDMLLSQGWKEFP